MNRKLTLHALEVFHTYLGRYHALGTSDSVPAVPERVSAQERQAFLLTFFPRANIPKRRQADRSAQMLCQTIQLAPPSPMPQALQPTVRLGDEQLSGILVRVPLHHSQACRALQRVPLSTGAFESAVCCACGFESRLLPRYIVLGSSDVESWCSYVGHTRSPGFANALNFVDKPCASDIS